MTGAAKNTMTKLLVDLGEACAGYQDRVLRDLRCETIEVDEIWAYCYAKHRNVPEEHRGGFGYADVWTLTAICADRKRVPTWLVGERTSEDAWVFLADLRHRLPIVEQVTSDALKAYESGARLSFRGVDWAQLQKIYAADRSGQARYSPPVCTGATVKVLKSAPDAPRISTSYVERQNLTMRMGMRRFTRLTKSFLKKVENLAHAVSLHFMHYNFCRPHQSLTLIDADGEGFKRTPAMAVEVADHVWTLQEVAGLAGVTSRATSSGHRVTLRPW
jgi:IS1 family transposase